MSSNLAASRRAADAPLALDISAWHPALVELYRYWSRLRTEQAERAAPLRRSFDPVEMPRHLSRIWMLEIEREPDFRLRYRLMGTQVERVVGGSLKGKWLDECHPTAKHPSYYTRYREVAETGVPSWRKGPPMFWHDKVALVENVILPFSERGERVDYFLLETRFYHPNGVEI